MGRTHDELMAELAPARRDRIAGRTAELVAEEKSLRDLRQARQLTQQKMAKRLGVRQHSISRLEQRSDMLLSTLRDYIGQMGGELVLTVRFPDREPVRIKGFAAIADTVNRSEVATISKPAVQRRRSIHRARRVRR